MRLIDAEPIEKSIAEWKARETNEPLTKTIVDNVGTWITHAPTVEAIPVEWIKTYIYSFHNYKFQEEREILIKMLKDWRIENERNNL